MSALNETLIRDVVAEVLGRLGNPAAPAPPAAEPAPKKRAPKKSEEPPAERPPIDLFSRPAASK